MREYQFIWRWLFLFCGICSVRGAEISGVVLHEGSPVTDATITIWERIDFLSDGGTVAASYRADLPLESNGSYVAEVESGSTYIVQVIPDIETGLLDVYYPSANSLWDADGIVATDDSAVTNVHFNLKRGAEISGTVLANQIPVSGASVSISPRNGGIFKYATTDSNGCYTILVEPGTNYIAKATPNRNPELLGEYYPDSDLFADAQAIEATLETPAKDIDFDLEPAARISGVLRSGSNTVSSAYVTVYQKIYSDFSDAWNYEYRGYGDVSPDGSYSAWVPPGSNYVVKAVPYHSTELLSEYYRGVRDQEDASLVTVTLESPAENVDFDLEQGAWISGFVRSGTLPESDLRVEVYDKVYDENALSWSDHFVEADDSDTNGAYRVLVSPGSNYIVFAFSQNGYFLPPYRGSEQGLYYDAAYPRENASFVATSIGSPAENINFDMNHLPVISGKVMSEGVPVHHAKMDVYQKIIYETNLFVVSYTTWVTSTEVEADGSYRVRLAPGTNYLLGVRTQHAPPFLPEFYNHARSLQDAEILSLSLDHSVSGVDFDLSAGFRIQGTVTDESGSLVQFPWISVQDHLGRGLNSRSSETDGWYSIYAPTGTPVYVSASGMGVEWEIYCDSRDLDNAEPLFGETGDTVTANFVLFQSSTDSDGDDIPDYQEESIPDGIYQQGADYSDLHLLDTDQDGLNDGEEKLCRTNPADRSDYLYIANSASTPEGMRVQWMSASGVQYFIECCPDLFVGEWEERAGPINGDGTLIQFTDPSVSETRAFYRICVRNP